jgi:hypothetical protein
MLGDTVGVGVGVGVAVLPTPPDSVCHTVPHVESVRVANSLATTAAVEMVRLLSTLAVTVMVAAFDAWVSA